MVICLLNLKKKKSYFPKKHWVLLAFVCFCFTQTNYAQFARHSWLNSKSYNHTICPTPSNGYTIDAVHQGCGIEKTLNFSSNTLPTKIDPLPITGITISVNSHLWHQKQYNFCMTDCDDADFNNISNNCGN